MRGLTLQQQVISQMEASQDRVREGIEGLNPDQMTMPAADGWSIRDHLTHLTIMHEFRFFEMGRVARGGRALFAKQTESEIDDLNAQFGGFRKDTPIEQVIGDLEFVWALLFDTAMNIDEIALDRTRYAEVSPQGGAEHDIAHAAAINAWRERGGI